MDRRAFTLGGMALLATRGGTAEAAAATWRCYVGSWTRERGGAGGDGGVHLIELAGATGALSLVASVDPAVNAGYLAISPDGVHLCATDERRDLGGTTGAGGGVVAYRIAAATGALDRINVTPSMGANPAYASFDHAGSRLAIANHATYEPVIGVRDGRLTTTYDDATVTLLPMARDGTIGPATAVATLDPGAGPTPAASAGLPMTFAASPHAHSANWSPSDRWLLVCDKGADRLYTFRVAGDRLRRGTRLSVRPGHSPRHSAFHPRLPLVLIVNEQVPTVDLYHLDERTGGLRHLGTCELLDRRSPAGGPVDIPADIQIHPHLPVAYATTRRADVVTVLRLSADPPALERVQVVRSGGRTPRSCAITPDGRWLLVANQDSGELTPFAVDRTDGRLTPAGTPLRLPRPVCIKVAPRMEPRRAA